MTIDISNLSQEKCAFLKANPDFLKSIEQTIPRMHARRLERNEKTKSHHQKEMVELEKRIAAVKRKYLTDPALREIQRRFIIKNPPVVASKLVCPKCRGSDQGNTLNGEPFCFKCKVRLVPKKKIRRK